MSKKKDKKITVAVSGGFDPPHSGHIKLFRAAKELGDELVVIINNDNWLRAKKDHPFMPENERRAIIEEFACVDRVVLTKHKPNPSGPEAMSVVETLRELKPDIFANGGDRNEEDAEDPNSSAYYEIKLFKELGTKMVFNVGGGKIQSSSWILDEYVQKVKQKEKGA